MQVYDSMLIYWEECAPLILQSYASLIYMLLVLIFFFISGLIFMFYNEIDKF